MSKLLYVSITGLRLKRFWHAPKFWRYAFAAMRQAQADPNCLSADARSISGVHHTRSVWRSREDMLTYLKSGEHLAAMKVFRGIATGKTYGFESHDVPDWTQVHALWNTHGRVV